MQEVRVHERSAGGNTSRQANVSPYFLSALTASWALYNRTKHSWDFFICFMIKIYYFAHKFGFIFKINSAYVVSIRKLP